MYPSGARANQPPAAPSIQDYNLLEECPTQPGIHPRVTWVAALGLTARFSIARSRSQMSPIATLDVETSVTYRVYHNNNDDTEGCLTN